MKFAFKIGCNKRIVGEIETERDALLPDWVKPEPKNISYLLMVTHPVEPAEIGLTNQTR